MPSPGKLSLIRAWRGSVLTRTFRKLGKWSRHGRSGEGRKRGPAKPICIATCGDGQAAAER